MSLEFQYPSNQFQVNHLDASESHFLYSRRPRAELGEYSLISGRLGEGGKMQPQKQQNGLHIHKKAWDLR